ncbi:DUF547 domain-containing protein [Roseococcus sp. SDR]|uniref:DUF547 domain-containing protein n=1 Tax=Roseococcus sp. SDR TaxID=2835532 RepID=UPI001BD1582B|nr:DUF547 domain-containing protein [Roseococcus sp. SDR]MBS7788534.1 DUF547 domain-containing protein [Roseococcus sp. SDR]MBV1843848.1 DUF547 domain-containing protein [Roseococcus sp. SDR]
MIRRRSLAAALLIPAAAGAAEPGLDALLARYAATPADGVTRVAYARWKANAADMAALDAWIAEAATRRPSAMPRQEAFAFWANLYNALTLKVVLERYPVRSIKEIRSTGVGLDPRQFLGPWRTRLVTIEGARLSLDDIEHGTMRPTFRDPRVHYAVNCASIGCPNLPLRAWRAASLEADLDAAARAFVNHPRGAALLPGGGLRVSSIYRWFREDFGGDDAGVITHLARYAAPPLAGALRNLTRVTEDAYDWALNDATPN